MKNKLLFKNTFFLYLLTFSTQLLNLITIPYQTRVLGPSVYGKVNVAIAVMTYVQLILDFGFILTATALVTKNQNKIKRISYIHSCVLYSKLLLSFSIIVIMIILNKTFNIFNDDISLYIIFLLAYIVNALVPDYIYRGLENMKSISLRTLAIKSLFAILIILFVKSPADYLNIPILMLIGNILSLIYSLLDIKKKYSIQLVYTKFSDIVGILKNSFPFFISRFSSTFYQGLNTVILGAKFKGNVLVGCYTSADKLISLSKSFSSPIADSLYPYMVKNKDFKLIKKILIFLMPLIVCLGVITFIWADPICIILFGEEYSAAGNILRCMLPIAVIILPTYILAFPVMSPMGIVKYANRSNVIGAAFQLLILTLLFATNNINVYTLAISASIIEIIVFIYRLSMVIKYRDRLSIKES